MLKSIQNIVDNQKKASFILMLFAILLYLPTIGYDYNIDDELVTRGHRFTSQGLSAVKDIFTNNYFDDGAGNTYEYRPMVHLSFAIEHQFFGESASMSHFINVLLYGLTAFLLYSFLIRFLGTKYKLLVAFVTLLFIVHPIHTEAVTSIKNRDEILAFIFILLSLKFILKYASEKGSKYFIPVVIFFLLGLLSKKSVVHFALIIPVVLVFYNNVISNIKYFGIALTLILIALFFADINTYSQLAVFSSLSVFSITIIKFLKSQNDYSFINKALDKVKIVFSNPMADIKEEKEAITNFNRFTIIFHGISTLVLLYVFYYSFNQNSFILFLSTLLVYFLLALSLKKMVNIYLTFTIFTVLLNISTVVFQLDSFVSVTFTLTYVFWYILYNKSSILYFITSISIGLICVLIPDNFGLDYLPGFVIFMIPLFFIKKYKGQYLIVLTVIYLLSVGSNAKIFFQYEKEWSSISEELNTALVNLIFLSFSWIKEKKRSIFLSVTFLFVLISSLYIVNEIHYMHKKDISVVEEPEKEAIKEIDVTKNTILGNQLLSRGRKLNYVEFPLEEKVNFNKKAGTSFHVLFEYLKVIIFPFPLSSYYGFSYFKEVSLSNMYALISVVLHIGILLISLINFYKKPLVFLGGFIYLTSVVVFSNLIVPVPGMMGIRLAYIAILGFLLFILGFANWENAKVQHFGNKSLLGVLVILIFSGFTFERNSNWKDNLTLLEIDAKRFSESAQLNNMLGTNYLKEAGKSRGAAYTKKLQNAIVYLEKATAIYPDFFNANYDIGRTSMLLGDYKKAIGAFERATEIKPQFVEAYFQKGLAYEKLGKNDLAIYSYLQGIEQDSSHLKSYTNVSAIYFRDKQFNKAVKINLEAVKNNPNKFEAIDNLAKSYYYNNEKLLAAQYFEQALQLKFSMDLLLTVANVYKEAGETTKSNYYFSEYNKRTKK